MLTDSPELIFKAATEKASNDFNTIKTVGERMSNYNLLVKEAKLQYKNFELAKRRASALKNKAIENLEKNLIDFEANFAKRGGKILWALDSKQAVDEIFNIVKKSNTDKNILFAKSLVVEEIQAKKLLKEKGIGAIESDFNDYLCSLKNQESYHISNPAINISNEDISKVFSEKFSTSKDIPTEDFVDFFNEHFYAELTEAEVAVTGANFLISDTGSVVLSELNANSLIACSSPKVQIVVVGIDQMLGSLMDLELYLSLYSSFTYGQKSNTFNVILSGPKQDDESDGPTEMYIVLIEDDRSVLLSKNEQRKSALCINCGACYNVCPVYKTVGGHVYGSVFGGPIGSITTPFRKGVEDYKHLSYASTLCGACTVVCPMNIPIHKLLMYNRRDFVESGLTTRAERMRLLLFKHVMKKRTLLDFGGNKLKNMFIRKSFGLSWSKNRELPYFSKK